VAALAALLATAWGRTSALVWAAAVIAIAGGAAWWASVAWRRVTVDAWFEPARAFIGEPTYLVVRVENAKPRALPIVRISVRPANCLMPVVSCPGKMNASCSVASVRMVSTDECHFSLSHTMGEPTAGGP